MAVKGTRETSKSHGGIVVILIVVIIILYMVATGTLNPIRATSNLVDMVLRYMPAPIESAIRSLINILINLFYEFVDILRRMLPV